jgi:hypothetical protein
VEKRSENVYILRASDGCQQATISLLRFVAEPSFEAFKVLCEKRLHFERRELADGNLESPPGICEWKDLYEVFLGRRHRKQSPFFGLPCTFGDGFVYDLP